MNAPESGAIKTNGTTLAEQIGAQIFIDAIAMACPDDPDLAVSLVRKAASVSHDGIAVEAACHFSGAGGNGIYGKRRERASGPGWCLCEKSGSKGYDR